MLVVIATDCISSCKSNYHTITMNDLVNATISGINVEGKVIILKYEKHLI